MSSKVKWGGIAGVVAAALLILSAILNQVSPIQATYDSAASYVYLGVGLVAYIAIIVAVLGIHALHSGTPRYGRLGVTGTVLTIAGYAFIAVMTVISMVQGYASFLTVRLAGAGVLLVGSVLLGVIILRARLLPLGVRRAAHRGVPARRSRERDLQFRRESAAGPALGLCGHCAPGTTSESRGVGGDTARVSRLTFER